METIVAAATVAIFALLVTPAFARNGKGQRQGQRHDDDRDLERQDRGLSRALARRHGWLRDIDLGLAGCEYPMVAVWCNQDVVSTASRPGRRRTISSTPSFGIQMTRRSRGASPLWPHEGCAR